MTFASIGWHDDGLASGLSGVGGYLQPRLVQLSQGKFQSNSGIQQGENNVSKQNHFEQPVSGRGPVHSFNMKVLGHVLKASDRLRGFVRWRVCRIRVRCYPVSLRLGIRRGRSTSSFVCSRPTASIVSSTYAPSGIGSQPAVQSRNARALPAAQQPRICGASVYVRRLYEHQRTCWSRGVAWGVANAPSNSHVDHAVVVANAPAGSGHADTGPSRDQRS